MEFRKHSEFEDKHAPLSASKPQWLRYSDERLFEYVDRLGTAIHGTKLHKLAKDLIQLKVKLPNNSQTFNAYVNDAIGYHMDPEVVLVYSKVAFGTTDAIGFRTEYIDGEECRVLRIFDLKTGVKPVTGEQLVVYAAYFCLEYNEKPSDVVFDLRIYQNDTIILIEPTIEDVVHIMSRITESSELLIKRLNEEV